MKCSIVIIAFIYLTNDLFIVDGFRLGPPDTACDTMTPGHGAEPQSMESFNYKIMVNASMYGPMHSLTVNISGEENFKGFFIQARRVSDDKIIGRFHTPLITSGKRIVGCGENMQGGISHSINTEKMMVSVVWMAPMMDLSDIYFKVTVVQDFSTYWVGMKSDTVEFNEMATMPPGQPGSGSDGGIGWPPLPPIEAGSSPLGCNIYLTFFLCALLGALNA